MSFVSLSDHDHIATVTLERPEALNAISGAMADELADTFEKVARNDDVWVVCVMAAGDKAFCVGADLKERAGFSLDDFHDNRAQIRRLFASVRALPQPSIAGVFGFALGGGCELALSCDLIVASDDATLGLPETSVGLLPAGGGTQLLARRVGPGRAKDLIFRARRLSAADALAIGMVTEVVPRSDLEATVRKIAEEIRGDSPVAVRAAKHAIDGGLGRPIEEGLEIKHEQWTKVIASDDRAEGIAAFNDKRDPEWKNR